MEIQVEEVETGRSWMSRLSLPDPKPGWVMRDQHPFPSSVGRCLCCSRKFRHCHPIYECAFVSVKISRNQEYTRNEVGVGQ
eukprot:5542555-Pleurochrysis_carterae.AAC.1